MLSPAWAHASIVMHSNASTITPRQVAFMAWVRRRRESVMQTSDGAEGAGSTAPAGGQQVTSMRPCAPADQPCYQPALPGGCGLAVFRSLRTAALNNPSSGQD